MTEKLTPHHLARRAIVYVRQSSHHQLVHNQESQRRQYAMEQRVRGLGWHKTEVIDEDQGRSAASTYGRTGSQRMVAEVCLGHVGAVAAIEVSRFARNNRDWHQLIELCGRVETLLIDHDAIYDPRHANDRLLLGLKGSMSEYELDLLLQRSLEARWAKARRGELVIEAPVGFLKPPPGVGVLSATALFACVGAVERFPSARHLASDLGLTPTERSSGAKRWLGGISKRGDTYLRTPLTHGARSVLYRAKGQQSKSRLQEWALRVEQARGRNTATVALANKIARIVWALLKKGETFQPMTHAA